MIVCICHNISEREVKSAIHSGLNSMHLLQENLAIGTCCGKCKSCTKKILRECKSDDDNAHARLHTLQFQPLAA